MSSILLYRVEALIFANETAEECGLGSRKLHVSRHTMLSKMHNETPEDRRRELDSDS